MTLNDETAARIADEAWSDRGKRHTVAGEEYVKAGYAARDAEVEELRHRIGQGDDAFAAAREDAIRARATLAKVADLLGSLDLDSGRTTAPGTAWGSILREALALASGADEWEYGLADDGATEPYSDISTDRDWILDGVHPLDEGTKLLRRRPAGPWMEVVPDDRA